METYTFCGYTRDELEAAFNKVADPNDWRGPIDAVVAAGEVPIVDAAIAFFTATQTFLTPTDKSRKHFRVQSVGYRVGPAGDH